MWSFLLKGGLNTYSWMVAHTESSVRFWYVSINLIGVVWEGLLSKDTESQKMAYRVGGPYKTGEPKCHQWLWYHGDTLPYNKWTHEHQKVTHLEVCKVCSVLFHYSKHLLKHILLWYVVLHHLCSLETLTMHFLQYQGLLCWKIIICQF